MLRTWSAFSPLDRLLDDVMNDVMGATFGTAAGSQNYVPAADVRVNDRELVVHIDVPGIRKEDLEVTLENGVLTIHGERKYEHGEKDRVLLGRGYGAFSKSFTLPEDVDAERLAAELHDGVLSIRVPRHEKARPRRIEISAGTADTKQLSE